MDANQIAGRNDEVYEIDLMELFFLFRQKLKYIVLAAIFGGLVVGAYTYFAVAPKYQATAKIYIVSASNDSVVNLTDLQIGTNLTADYQELVLSRPMMESILQNLELDMTTEQLKKMLTVENPSGTRILKLTATSTDPKQAEQIANEMARLAIAWLPEVMETNEPNIAEPAILPQRRCSPSYSKNTLVGAVAFAVLYFGFCVVRYLLDDTIRTAEELERYFGITPLAMIPENGAIRDDSEDTEKKSLKAGRKGKRG